MKALFLKNGQESDRVIISVVKTNFTQLEVVIGDIISGDIIDLLNEAGQISLIIVNTDHQPTNLALQLENIADCLGELPTVFICSPQTIKTHLNEQIINNQKTNYIVPMPLTGSKLQEAIQAVIARIKETEFQESVGEFTFDDLQPMRIKNFFIFNQVPYDVYMQLTAINYGKIIQGNHTYSHQQIQSYAQKGVKYLYVRKDESLKFLMTSIKNISKFYAIKNLEKKKLILLHQQSIFFIREFIQRLSVTDEIVKLTQLFIESSSTFIRSETDLAEVFELVIQNRSITFAQQTLLAIYLARSILLKMQWNSDLALNKIALAAILQDINLTNEDLIKIRSVNDPVFKEFTDIEQKDFLEHAEKAASIARLFNGFTDVDFILLEHHERPTSDGFPKGVNASSLTTISCIFILTNNIVSKMAQHPICPPPVFREIVKQLKTNFSSGNFKEPYKLLEKIAKEMNS